MNHSTYLRLSAFAVSSLLLGMAMTGCGGNGKNDENSNVQITDSIETGGVEIDITDFEPEAKISGLKYDKPVYNKETDTYSFDVKATLSNVTTKPQLKYTLEYSLDENQVLTSDNGKFEGVKPLEQRSYYILRAECEGLEPVQLEIPAEIMPVIPKIAKPTAKEIEAKLNDSKAPLLTNSEVLNPNCKFEVQGKDLNYEITSIQKVYENIEYDWGSVEVVSLGYDEFNRVNKIVMK